MKIDIDGIDYGFMFERPNDLIVPSNSGILLLKGAGSKISLPMATYYWIDLLRKKVYELFDVDILSKWNDITHEQQSKGLLWILGQIGINIKTQIEASPKITVSVEI